MIVVIDGYNLLKQIIKNARATEKQRRDFITYIKKYAQSKQHTIILVFDGGPRDYPTHEKNKQITIVYSGKETADEYIKTYIQEHLSSNMLIVSSDRALCTFSSYNGIPSMEALAFFKLTQETKLPPIRLEKCPGKAQKLLKSKENPELDALMQEATAMVMYKDENSCDIINKSHGKTLSKLEKEMLKIAKKI